MTLGFPPARLIVNADDLGLAESVNRGILETMESGIVRSASLMVNMGAHDDAIRRLGDARRRGLDVGIGLHFNIVAGAPLTECRTLADSRTGRFHSLGRTALAAFARRIDRRDVEAELEAQLSRAESLLAPIGMRVTHIDSHRHAHCLPGIFDVVVLGARTHGIKHVRHPTELSPTLLHRLPALLVARLLRFALPHRRLPDEVAFAGLALMGSRTLDRDLQRLIAALPPGATELMVHPGYDSPDLAALDPFRAPREREVRALTSPALRSWIRERGTELTHFGATAPPA